MRNEPIYEINNSEFPPSCLPTSLDKSNLIDITCIGDQWRKYLDTSNGKVHDGAEYYAASLRAREFGVGD
jgi:hypothetical protein